MPELIIFVVVLCAVMMSVLMGLVGLWLFGLAFGLGPKKKEEGLGKTRERKSFVLQPSERREESFGLGLHKRR